MSTEKEKVEAKKDSGKKPRRKTSHSSVTSRSILSRCKRRASTDRRSRSKTSDPSDHADRSASDVDSMSRSSKGAVSDTSVEIYKVKQHILRMNAMLGYVLRVCLIYTEKSFYSKKNSVNGFGMICLENFEK